MIIANEIAIAMTKGHWLLIIDKIKIAVNIKYVNTIPVITIHLGKREVKNINIIERKTDKAIIPINIALALLIFLIFKFVVGS